jgi:L-cysteine desulfidase
MDNYTAMRILNANITKTMGCTDIGVVGYIASIGAYTLRNKTIQSIHLTMSEELYKNSVNVGIPGLRKSGLEQALALGLLLQDPKKQLSVFESVTDDDINQIQDLLKQIEVTIVHKQFEDTVLYEKLEVTAKEGDTTEILIKDAYDNVKYVIRNGEKLKEFEQVALIERVHKYDIDNYDEILKFVHKNDFSSLEELFVTADKQYTNAKEAIKAENGDYLAEQIKGPQRTCIYDLSNFLRKHIAVPSKKRMLGDVYTVYGVAGSGNLGIGTLITPMFLSDVFELPDSKRRQLIVLAFLTSVYVKQHMNVVTVLCGTGHAIGASAAAVTAFIKEGKDDQIKDAINLYLSSSMGFVCDGAKLSCTYKVSFAAMNGMIAGKMVLDHSNTCDGTGLNKMNVDDTIKNLGKLNNEILKGANKGIVELI